ncbi:hypothetical protein DMUE_4165 [Dictyocoela muelleri]|nr:hypothetical protein DMUE_4165 [Dictyocoela muelleri]
MFFGMNNNFNKSNLREKSKYLIVNYLLTGCPLGGRRKLSSIIEISRTKDEIKKQEISFKTITSVDEKTESAYFEYRSEKSGLRISHKLNLLLSIEEQDILSWRACFLEVARICKWTEEIKLEVLTQIVDINIQYNIGPTETSDEVLHKILKLKYNTNNAHRYQSQLGKIKQSKYYTVRGYYKSIETASRKLGICLDWSDK